MDKCPCCEHRIEDTGFGAICQECWWELGVDEDLSEARQNYAEYGAINPHCYWCKTGKELPNQ